MNILNWFRRSKQKTSGAIAESLACKYLQNNQYTIIEVNFTCKLGEIDIIASDQQKLVFVEVKYRKEKTGSRTAKAAVTKAKQKKIILTAKWYLKGKYKDSNDLPACRFDVITLEGDLSNPDIELYKNAFRVN